MVGRRGPPPKPLRGKACPNPAKSNEYRWDRITQCLVPPPDSGPRSINVFGYTCPAEGVPGTFPNRNGSGVLGCGGFGGAGCGGAGGGDGAGVQGCATLAPETHPLLYTGQSTTWNLPESVHRHQFGFAAVDISIKLEKCRRRMNEREADCCLGFMIRA